MSFQLFKKLRTALFQKCDTSVWAVNMETDECGCTLSLSSWFVSKAHDKYLMKIINNINCNIDNDDDNDNNDKVL